MQIGKKFNTLTLKEYFFYIEHRTSYTDFNTLGLYRSIVENEKLSLEEKISVRDYAHRYFKKFFDFLQIKDPYTYFLISTLGQDLTKGDEKNFWNIIRKNQQKILQSKKIKHRNFGTYSKHDCGDETCPYNGMMIKEGSILMESWMQFDSDKHKFGGHWQLKEKSEKHKSDRKNEKQIIRQKLDEQNE